MIAIVLGCLGLASSLMTLATLAVRPWMQQTLAASMPPPRDQKLRDAQLAMQQQIETVNRRYETWNWGFALANLAVSATLLAGGIMALRICPKVRKLLIGVLTLTILVEVVRTIVHVVMQLEMAPVVAESMSRMMAAAPHGASGASQGAAFAVSAAKAGIYLAIAVAVGWLLAKLIFCVVGIWYLRRPSICPLFERAESGE